MSWPINTKAYDIAALEPWTAHQNNVSKEMAVYDPNH
jgi:hypothetical protein